MSTAGFEAIDHTVQLTHRWVNELDAMVGWDNKPRAYRLIRTVLQAVRDWLQGRCHINRLEATGRVSR